jgi:heme o synthase
VPTSMMPCAIGFAGAIYGATAAICGAMFLWLAFQLCRSDESDRRAARRLFIFSITYLFVLFAALFADHHGSLSSPTAASRRASAALVQFNLFLSVDGQTAGDPVRRVGEG